MPDVSTEEIMLKRFLGGLPCSIGWVGKASLRKCYLSQDLKAARMAQWG